MNVDDEDKQGKNAPRQHDADGRRRTVSRDDDLLDDVEFDLIDEVDEGEDTLNDVFARDTAIPAASPEHLAAEAMRKVDAHEIVSARSNGRPQRPRVPPPPPPPRAPPAPPPMRARLYTPVTIEPPPEDIEFDDADGPIDVFGNELPGTQPQNGAKLPNFGGSELPTAPPGGGKGLLDQSKRSSRAPERAARHAFLADTARHQPVDAQVLARATAPRAGLPKLPALRDAPGAAGDSALDFMDGLDPLLDSLAPMANLDPPPPVSSAPRGGAKEMQECYALGDYNRALELAEQLLARSPDDTATRRCAQSCREALTQMYAARIGPLDQVMTVNVSPAEVQWLSLDHRAGFLLSLVDGQSTVDEILDISGMTRLDALKIINDLTERQVVRLA
jgi:hypothetical protein